MRGLRLQAVAVVVSLLVVSAQAQAQAQTPARIDDPAAQALRDEIAQLRRDFEARLAALEQRLATVDSGAPPPPVAVPPPVEAPVAQAAVTQAGAASSKIFNPDMAVIGNFVGAAGTNHTRPSPSLQMREAEASFQAVVDPYARADFFMAFGEEGVELEEGYVTFPTLPAGLLLRVGKMRAAFGKVNTFHTHVSPWPDRPLVTENLVGGEEGITDAGLSVARLIPNPWVFLEATGQVFRGDSGDVYAASQPSDLNYVGHVRGYHDLNEATNIDLGGSVSYGHNPSGVVNGTDLDHFTTTLYGVDATVRWRPLQRSIYRSLIGRSEVIWSQREQPDGTQRANGFYVSGDYQFARRWFTGVRFDRSDRANEAALHDTGQSLTLTYLPSEFSLIRGQYRRQRYAEGETANEFLFQFQFAIGAHGAHPF